MRQPKCKTLLFTLMAVRLIAGDQRCATCHPKEVAGYARSGMARSLGIVNATLSGPDGSFEHEFSKTAFSIRWNGSRMTQELTRQHESVEQTVAYVIGSGNHAFGYLTQVGDHVFQSPLSYFTNRQMWDVAPGYQFDSHPDFSRPVTAECLLCHSGKALPIPDSLNRYQPGVFATYGISCERCHGDAEAHLKKPVPGSILNPAKLNGAARASICEQCHLTGETRIPNPGQSISDFRPGHVLEDYYSTYVAQALGPTIKVVSHVEQLALSRCARASGDKLWCGTCHNPHDKPLQPAAYFRERCLGCHAATLSSSHAAPGRGCAGCHMPKTPTRDGGHTAFTDHRVALHPKTAPAMTEPGVLIAWREPESALRERNVALALVAFGTQNQSSAELIRGYQLLNRMEKDFPNDPVVLTSLGLVLLKGKQPEEALKRFDRVLALKPSYAPYYVNAATALLAAGHQAGAAQELQKAITLDPLLQTAVQLLAQIYREQGDGEKANDLAGQYEKAMGISHH